MKNKVDKIVVLLFIVTMCFLMSVSVYATETETVHNPKCAETNGISIQDDVFVCDTGGEGDVSSAHETFHIWDFTSYPVKILRNATITYEGITIYGSYQKPYSIINENGLGLMRTGAMEEDCVTFVPEYDGELIDVHCRVIELI